MFFVTIAHLFNLAHLHQLEQDIHTIINDGMAKDFSPQNSPEKEKNQKVSKESAKETNRSSRN
jgi:hypothetical protein